MGKNIGYFKSKTKMEIYTDEEFNEVYDIIAEYYDGDDIEDFIYSTDIEEKEDFIMENNIKNLRVCNACGKFMSEGYIFNDFETYCSDKCFIKKHGKATFDAADEDELYWTDWEG